MAITSGTEAYAIALARARVPATTNFFWMILRDDNGKNYMSTAKFYAAVGLAQLGESSGYLWLIENSGDPLPIISGAWPRGVANNNVDTRESAAREFPLSPVRSTPFRTAAVARAKTRRRLRPTSNACKALPLSGPAIGSPEQRVRAPPPERPRAAPSRCPLLMCTPVARFNRIAVRENHFASASDEMAGVTPSATASSTSSGRRAPSITTGQPLPTL